MPENVYRRADYETRTHCVRPGRVSEMIVILIDHANESYYHLATILNSSPNNDSVREEKRYCGPRHGSGERSRARSGKSS